MSEKREILFRGKRVDNGEWIEGYFLPGNERQSLHPCIFVYLPETQNFECFDIDIDTLSEYTGLTDKNGTRIFEGDIVKVLNAFNVEVVFKKGAFGVYSSYVDYDYLDSEIAEITGCNNPSRFCRCDNFVSLWELMWNYNQEDDCCSVVEIIGNIHDNGYPF